MFYLILIIKLLILLFLPIYLNRIVQNDESFSKLYINTIFLLFVIYSALLTYIPFTFYYFENEVNIQTFIPFYGLIGFIIFYSVLPIIIGLLIAGIMIRVKINGMATYRAILFLPQIFYFSLPK